MDLKNLRAMVISKLYYNFNITLQHILFVKMGKVPILKTKSNITYK